MAETSEKKTLPDLLVVMAALRTPVTGCPWDLEQNYRTIAPYTLEEAYEVVDAIERGNLPDLQEELGDLLLQVVYHARLAEEDGAFAFPDVVDGITRKMIRRHPHVFGDASARSTGAAKDFWEVAKAAEKAMKAQAETDPLRPAPLRTEAATPGASDAAAALVTSLLADVPVGLPALTRAIKLQDKAARVGFDWPSLAPVLDKMREELAELEAEVASRLVQSAGASDASAPDTSSRIEDEFGDLLFVMANLARYLRLDPEAALRRANQKFTRRFNYIERSLAEQGRAPDQSNLAEMDRLWNQAKAAEKEPR